jgi:transposase
MVAAQPTRRQARSLRWLTAPWDAAHPDWLRLDRQLPAEHRVRLIDRVVDLLDLQPQLRVFYAGFGSASWHPALLLKLMLYELDRKVLSPAAWFRDCSEHTPLQWLLRGARPCRASCYEGRRRLSPTLLEQLNHQVLLLGRSEGFCPARRGSLDGTFTAAKGSRHHLLNLQRLDKRLAVLEQTLALDQLGQPLKCRPRWLARSVAGRQQQQQRYQLARQRLLAKLARHNQAQARRAKAKRRSAKRVVICVREPEAVIGKDKSKVVRPLYDTQLLRDLDSPFILGYGVFASATDAGLLPEMLVRTRRQAGTLPEKLLADAIYGSVTDLRACVNERVILYAPVKGAAAVQAEGAENKSKRVPLATVEGERAGPKYYGKEQFVWDEATRTYSCPAGQRLQKVKEQRESRVNGEGVQVEKYASKACGNCVQRQQCSRSKQGRQIKRLVDEPLLEALRQRMATEQGKELYKLRKQTIELAFADIKEHRGLRQFCGFGLQQAETQVALLVLLHNGKALLQLRQAAKQPA